MARIVLASGSPRRKELLERIGISEFTVRVPDADETYPADFTPRQVVEHMFSEDEFYTTIPFASLSRDDPNYDPAGGYWLPLGELARRKP